MRKIWSIQNDLFETEGQLIASLNSNGSIREIERLTLRIQTLKRELTSVRLRPETSKTKLSNVSLFKLKFLWKS